jgi:hypothetical protein
VGRNFERRDFEGRKSPHLSPFPFLHGPPCNQGVIDRRTSKMTRTAAGSNDAAAAAAAVGDEKSKQKMPTPGEMQSLNDVAALIDGGEPGEFLVKKYSMLMFDEKSRALSFRLNGRFLFGGVPS